MPRRDAGHVAKPARRESQQRGGLRFTVRRDVHERRRRELGYVADDRHESIVVGGGDRERFRAFRHSLAEKANDRVRRTGFVKFGTDYAVPLDQNREMMAIYRRMMDEDAPGRYVIYGHIGDAHVHINSFPETREQFERGKQAMTALAREAVKFGGTVGAEHGLGKRKAHLLQIQYPPDQIEAMKQVKRRFDPDWLLGRGTLFPYPD